MIQVTWHIEKHDCPNQDCQGRCGCIEGINFWYVSYTMDGIRLSASEDANSIAQRVASLDQIHWAMTPHDEIGEAQQAAAKAAVSRALAAGESRI